MKRLMTTTAAALVLGTAAFAQDDASTDGAATQNNASGFGGVQAEATDFMASDLLGMRLYTTESELPSQDSMVNVAETDWENVGEINDLIVAQDGQVDGVIVGVGGFLGIGEKAVAISMDQVTVFSGEAGERFLVIQASESELEAAPEFQDPQQQAQQEGMNASTGGESGGTGMAEGEAMGDGSNMAEGEGMAEGESADSGSMSGEESGEQSGEDAAMAEDSSGEQASGEGENLTESAEQPEMTDDQAASEGDGASMSVDESTAETEGEQSAEAEDASNSGGMAEGEDMASEETAGSEAEASAEGEDMAEGEAAAEGDQQASSGNAPEMEREGYQTRDISELTAEDLMGTTVYDVNDESLGDVSDMVVGDSGEIEQFVIDVGGFLGIGSKPVAVPYDQVQVMSAGEGMSDVRVYVDATEDELESMEEYQGE